MQVPHDLIEGGREGAIDVAEEALGVREAEGPAEVDDDGLEALRGAHLADLAPQGRRSAPNRLEPHHHLAVGLRLRFRCGGSCGRGGGG